MSSQPISGFRSDYLVELQIAEHHLGAIADAIPPERYSWRPTDTARSVSEVFVHIAAGNLLLLDQVGTRAPQEVYGTLDEQGFQRNIAIVLKNQELGKTIRDQRPSPSSMGRAAQSTHGVCDPRGNEQSVHNSLPNTG